MMIRIAARIATTTLFGAATLMASATLLAAPASADTVESCEGGVLVVVDFTDLGGEVETGCAEGDPESGRAALESAGFTPVDSSPGLLCTINAQPDPCAEFDGTNFWAYWQVQDGEWAFSQAGFDEADPTPGGIEGWRYNDGSVPPPLPEAAGEVGGSDATEEATDNATDEATDEPTNEPTDDATEEDATDAGTTDEDSSGGLSPALWVVIGVVVVALVIGVVVRVTNAKAAAKK